MLAYLAQRLSVCVVLLRPYRIKKLNGMQLCMQILDDFLKVTHLLHFSLLLALPSELCPRRFRCGNRPNGRRARCGNRPVYAMSHRGVRPAYAMSHRGVQSSSSAGMINVGETSDGFPSCFASVVRRTRRGISILLCGDTCCEVLLW